MSRYYIYKFSNLPFKSYDFLQHRSIDVFIFLPVAPDRKLIWYGTSGGGFNFLIDVLYAEVRF
jgi:hypothetical protein